MEFIKTNSTARRQGLVLILAAVGLFILVADQTVFITQQHRQQEFSGNGDHNDDDTLNVATNNALLEEARFVAGSYTDVSWSRQATLGDTGAMINSKLTKQERKQSILEVEENSKKMRARVDEVWKTKHQNNAAFQRCLGTRTLVFYGDSHATWMYKLLGEFDLGGRIKTRTIGSFSKKDPSGGFLATVSSKYLRTDAVRHDEWTLRNLFVPKRRHGMPIGHVSHVLIATGAWHVLFNNTHPYDLYWRIRAFVRDLRTQLQNVTLIGYIPHYYHPPRDDRKPWTPCATKSRILAMREASLAAYAAEKVDWVVDAWQLTKAHRNTTDRWGHHYHKKVNLLILQDILNTVFKCGGSDDAKEEIDSVNVLGNGVPGAGGQFFTTGPKVTRIFKPHQVCIKDRFVKPGTNPAHGVEDRATAEGARVPWPDMRICSCVRNQFYEICEEMLVFSNPARAKVKKKRELVRARWQIARHYCELGKKQLESTGALSPRPLDETRILNITVDPNAIPLPPEPTVPYYSPFPNVTLINTTKHLTTADRWDHFLGLVCDISVNTADIRRCMVNLGGELFEKIAMWNVSSSNPEMCLNLVNSSKTDVEPFRSPPSNCPSVKVGCADNQQGDP